MLKRVKLDTLAFIGYQMYYLNKTKEEIDHLTPFATLIAKDSFDSMKDGEDLVIYFLKEN